MVAFVSSQPKKRQREKNRYFIDKNKLRSQFSGFYCLLLLCGLCSWADHRWVWVRKRQALESPINLWLLRGLEPQKYKRWHSLTRFKIVSGSRRSLARVHYKQTYWSNQFQNISAVRNEWEFYECVIYALIGRYGTLIASPTCLNYWFIIQMCLFDFYFPHGDA